jgi:hypothetical protein
MSHETALHIMLNGDGAATRPDMFDPDLLSTFAKHHLLFAAAADTFAADQKTLQRDLNVHCQSDICLIAESQQHETRLK